MAAICKSLSLTILSPDSIWCYSLTQCVVILSEICNKESICLRLVVVVTHQHRQSWPLTKAIQAMSDFCWKYWKPLLCKLIIEKVGWMVFFFPPSLCSWQRPKCLQLSVECIILAQCMWLGCTLTGCVLTVVTVRHDWFPLTHFHCNHSVSLTEKSNSFLQVVDLI